MALDEATQAELDELIADARDRELSEQQGERLAEILRSDRDARVVYLRAVDQCASIRRYSADLSFTHDPAQAGASSMLTEALMRQRIGAEDVDIEKLPEAIVAGPTGAMAEPLLRLPWGTFEKQLVLVGIAAVVFMAVPIVMFLVWTVQAIEARDAENAVRITAVETIEWSDGSEPIGVGESLAEHQLNLDAGELELTFASGAVVRIVGPCEFVVHDRMGGDLRYGRLAAHVPAEASGFTVTGPGFAVIDRGTAFRLDVPQGGKPWVHVSEGAVDLALTNRDGTVRRSMRLTEDLSAEVDPEARQVTVTEPVAIAAASTGVGLELNEPDANWTVSAQRFDGPRKQTFKPGPAFVTQLNNTWLKRDAEDAARWITVKPNNPVMPGSTVHTFATRFDLTGLNPETAKLRLRFIADNRVEQLRVNGLAVDVPDHGQDPPFSTFTEMTLRHVFLEGINTIEFDVRNILPTDAASPTGLIVELRGSAHRMTRIDIRSGADR